MYCVKNMLHGLSNHGAYGAQEYGKSNFILKLIKPTLLRAPIKLTAQAELVEIHMICQSVKYAVRYTSSIKTEYLQ